MNDTPTILRLPGLTPLERIELEDCLDAGLLEFEDQTVDKGNVGEPITTTAIIVLSTVALKGLISWLLKNRLSKQFEKTVETIGKDGTIVRTTIKVNLNSSTAEADVLKQLGFSDDPKSLLNS